MNKIAEIKFFERLTRKNDSEATNEENASNLTKIIKVDDIKKDLQDFKKFLLSNININDKQSQQFSHLKSS
jgi:hypothetical protein